MCRREFFPREEPPRTIDDDDDDQSLDAAEIVEIDVLDICDDIRAELEFSHRVSGLAEYMAEALRAQGWHRLHHNVYCTAAVAVYMASCVVGEDLSLDAICRVVRGSRQHHVWETYCEIYPRREGLVPTGLVVELCGGDLRGFWGFLKEAEVGVGGWGGGEDGGGGDEGDEEMEGEHDLEEGGDVEGEDGDDDGDEGMDEEEDGESGEGSIDGVSISDGTLYLEYCDFCRPFCSIGYNRKMNQLFDRIAAKIRIQGILLGESSRLVAAVSIFTALRLTDDDPPPDDRIAEATETPLDAIRRAYRVVYARREDILDQRMLFLVGQVDIGRALEAVPPLKWPRMRNRGLHDRSYVGE